MAEGKNDEGRTKVGEKQKQNVHKKYTTAVPPPCRGLPWLAGMKNSLVAPTLIAIFVRGILAKFSHLQQDRGRTILSPMSPFFSPPCFISRRETSLSNRPFLPLFSFSSRLFPSPCSWDDFIKFALIIPPGGSPLVETTALLLGNARHCSFYRGDL